jgi:hypothetical protein
VDQDSVSVNQPQLRRRTNHPLLPNPQKRHQHLQSHSHSPSELNNRILPHLRRLPLERLYLLKDRLVGLLLRLSLLGRLRSRRAVMEQHHHHHRPPLHHLDSRLVLRPLTSQIPNPKHRRLHPGSHLVPRPLQSLIRRPKHRHLHLDSLLDLRPLQSLIPKNQRPHPPDSHLVVPQLLNLSISNLSPLLLDFHSVPHPHPRPPLLLDSHLVNPLPSPPVLVRTCLQV